MKHCTGLATTGLIGLVSAAANAQFIFLEAESFFDLSASTAGGHNGFASYHSIDLAGTYTDQMLIDDGVQSATYDASIDWMFDVENGIFDVDLSAIGDDPGFLYDFLDVFMVASIRVEMTETVEIEVECSIVGEGWFSIWTSSTGGFTAVFSGEGSYGPQVVTLNEGDQVGFYWDVSNTVFGPGPKQNPLPTLGHSSTIRVVPAPPALAIGGLAMGLAARRRRPV